MLFPIEGLAGLRILVAEDEMLILLDIEAILDEVGCEIVGLVASVDAALTTIRLNDLDGALLDMSLHGKRITPVAEELVARGVPFLLCTGYGREPNDEAAIRDAPRLTKPFSTDSLRAAMNEAFKSVART
ncbi:response regulator [Psychromarinibacter sp. C21-152]|uniref:Response regulator n=1 Tax=Psychromarinibacter sediminicola TaxID=3033385 RepID=A0AAE3T8X4_9RHOB|nr:response regulator [Psychromarinibacter sediminicola]MDF0601895.1 response regulator [Psychromarinibacter sediminicola]